MPLPDAVIQGMGWGPPPIDDSLVGAPVGIMPPMPVPSAPAPAPVPAPLPAQMPSPAPPVDRGGAGGAPQKPPTLAQQQGDATNTQNRADYAAQSALGQQVNAKLGEAEQVLQAQADHQKRLDDIGTERARLADEKKKSTIVMQSAADAAEKRLDNYKVDPGQYWNNLGLGNHIGLYIAMALSGVGNALQGKGSEPNPVIQMIQQRARDNILAQQDERNQLGQQAERALQRVDRNRKFFGDQESDLLLKESQVDKQLATSIGLASAKSADANIRANGAAESAKLIQSSADKKAQAVERAVNHDIQNKQLGISAGHLQLGRDQFQHQVYKDLQELDLKAKALAQKGDIKGSEVYQKFGVPGVTHDDGTPFVATGSAEGIDKVRNKVAAAKTIVGLLDQARDVRTGYSNNNVASREEWQRLKQLWGAAKAKGKDALGLGALSESDFKLLDEYLGADDPTTYRDPTAGILQARQTVLRDVNDTLGAYNRDGTKFKIDDLDPNPPGPPKPTDESLKEALGPGADIQPQRLGGRVAGLVQGGTGENVSPIASSVKQNLDTWGAMLSGGDEAQAKKAADYLGQISKTAQVDAVKAYASKLLSDNMTNQVIKSTQPADELPVRVGARIQPPAK